MSMQDEDRGKPAMSAMQIARLAQIKTEPIITVNVNLLEVEKPSGGGRGQSVPYTVDVMILGDVAFTLQAHHFAKAGQMEAFIQAIKTWPKPRS